METALHRELKAIYASSDENTEVNVDGFRIDAIAAGGELIEVQHASLGALRSKTLKLLKEPKHRLRIVKPIIARKRLVTLRRKGGEVLRSRWSPKRAEFIDLFMDLVHFASVFPQKRLTLEVLLIESEEVRVDLKRPTRRGKRHQTLEQRLVGIQSRVTLRTKADLLRQLPLSGLPPVFDTAQLAEAVVRPRWFAQKIAYCLREIGASQTAGKRGNSQLYKLTHRLPAKKAA